MNIDFTNRVYPIFKDLHFINNENLERITNIALPFLSLYQPTAIASTAVLGVVRTWSCLSSCYGHFKSSEWRQIPLDLGTLAYVVSSVAVCIIFPPLSALLQYTVNIAYNLVKLDRALWNNKPKEAAYCAIEIISSAVYIASILSAEPALVLLALLSQAVLELKQSYSEFKQDHYPECAAKLLMAALRTCRAAPIAQTLYRNSFGKKITQEEFHSFLKQLISEDTAHTDPNQKINVEDFFKDQGFSSYLDDLTLGGKYENLRISNLLFRNCIWIQAEFSECIIENTSFRNCDMHNFRALNSIFHNTSWIDTKLTDATFYNTLIYRSAFVHCDLSQTCFAESIIYRVQIFGCRLLETNFFSSSADLSSIVDSDLTDTLLLDLKNQFHIEGGTPHKITRPVIGITWNHQENQEYAYLESDALIDNKAIVLKFDYNPRGVDEKVLESEVQSILAGIKKFPNPDGLSIPDELLKRSAADSQIGKLKSIAQKISLNVDGMLISGGYDVEPEFYGKEREYTFPEKNYIRSMFEFALIEKAIHLDKTLMGICRGAQMINVFQGGTLKQHIDGHNGVLHMLELDPSRHDPSAETMRAIIGEDRIIGISCHHQTMDRIGKDLEMVLEYDKVPKALLGTKGTIILSQFHPEYYIYADETDFPSDYRYIQLGRNIFAYFVEKSAHG